MKLLSPDHVAVMCAERDMAEVWCTLFGVRGLRRTKPAFNETADACCLNYENERECRLSSFVCEADHAEGEALIALIDALEREEE